MIWYFFALGGYALGYVVYSGAAAIAIPGVVAKVLGVLVGLAPLAVLIRKRVVDRRRRPRAMPRIAAAPAPPAWSPALEFAELPQRPIPCRRCGAPMTPFDRAGNVDLVQCPYCRRIEDVPRDAASRIAFLRARAAELRAARQELTDIDRRAAGMIEDGTWLRGTLLAALGPSALIVCLVVLPGVYAGGIQGMWIGVGMFAQLGGIVLGMALSYRAISRRYLRVIRPRILARAPERAGAPARCRVCGGAVEVRGSAFVACPFCGSSNLVARELVPECRRFLDAEIAEYHHRASSANREVAAHDRLVSRGVMAGNVLGSLVGPGLFTAALWLLTR